MGQIGMRYEDFWETDMRTTLNIIKGFQDREIRLSRESWEQTRFLAMYLAAPYSKRKIKKPTDVTRFPWEVEETPETIDPERMEQLRKRWRKWDAEEKKRHKAKLNGK